MAFNDYNPVNSGLLQGFSLAQLMQRAAMERSQMDMAKRRESRFSNEASIHDQLARSAAGFEEDVPGSGTGLSAQLQAAPTGENAPTGEADYGAAPAAPLADQLAAPAGRRERITQNGVTYSRPDRATREKDALDRKIQEIKATETAKGDLADARAERNKITMPPGMAKELGFPEGTRFPAEHADDFGRMLRDKRNADAKDKENPIVRSSPALTNNAGDVTIVHTYKDGTLKVDKFPGVGKKTPEKATLPASNTAQQRLDREEQITTMGSEALNAKGGDAKQAEAYVLEKAKQPGADNPWKKNSIKIIDALRKQQKTKSKAEQDQELLDQLVNSGTGAVADPRLQTKKKANDPLGIR